MNHSRKCKVKYLGALSPMVYSFHSVSSRIGSSNNFQFKCYLNSNTKVFDELLLICWLSKMSLPNN